MLSVGVFGIRDFRLCTDLELETPKSRSGQSRYVQAKRPRGSNGACPTVTRVCSQVKKGAAVCYRGSTVHTAT